MITVLTFSSSLQVVRPPCHINHLHILLHYIHECPLRSSSSPSAWHLHVWHCFSSTSTIPPNYVRLASQMLPIKHSTWAVLWCLTSLAAGFGLWLSCRGCKLRNQVHWVVWHIRRAFFLMIFSPDIVGAGREEDTAVWWCCTSKPSKVEWTFVLCY